MRPVRVSHVRPCENEYDQAYWAQNERSFNIDTWQPGHPDHYLHRGTIQEVEGRQPNVEVYYYMNDVHYYLSDWQPLNQEDKDLFFCSGINFFPCPGRY